MAVDPDMKGVMEPRVTPKIWRNYKGTIKEL